jgi:malate dehydrogenase (oxaloacetate-decarboxylating)
LETPRLNKGAAFSVQERAALGLTGLLPPAVTTLELDVARAYAQYARQPDALTKYDFLAALRERNEILYFRLLADHLGELLPIIYTPTIGAAIERDSVAHQHRRGVYLSIDHPEAIEEAFANYGAGPDEIDLLVATDAEQILGIGDWGVHGMDICLGKLAVYTAAGLDPARALPIMLDVGTDRSSLLEDLFYLGERHPRVRGARYDAFIAAYVEAAARHFPHAVLHWEDLGAGNARRILERYRDEICTFNDDMQGTGAIVVAALLSAIRTTGLSLSEQRIVILGAGTAGIGIADQLRDHLMRAGLSAEEAMARFWCVGRRGLLTDDREDLRDFQVPYARPAHEAREWTRNRISGDISLEAVVRHVHPTILIGVSTCPGAFGEAIVREMATHVERPIIFPLSNPQRLAEAQARNLLAWTQGRALIATGSPAGAITHEDNVYQIAQANNALIFPGLGLGAIVARASRITDGMLAAAAQAVADLVVAGGSTDAGASLLPGVEELRTVSVAVAQAVALAAAADGVAHAPVDRIGRRVQAAQWEPVYPRLVAQGHARAKPLN